MRRTVYIGIAALTIACTLMASSSQAAFITLTAGTNLGFADGAFVGFGDWGTAVTTAGGGGVLADPAFAVSNGLDGQDNNTGDQYMGNWAFAGGAIADPITAASLTFGVFDADIHNDPAAQTASFTVDGVDLTAELNTVMDAAGGAAPGFGQGQYNIFTVNLAPATFAALLADGSAAVSLTLQNGFAFGPVTGNVAAVDFSTLSITTASAAAVPEPSSLALFMGAMAWGGLVRRRRS